MGWLDYHLWEFEAGDERYGLPDPDWPDDRLSAAKTTRLKTLIDQGVRQILYTYEMGDSWEHIVTLEAIEDGETGTKYPRYGEGEHRTPPEDCGGTPGFEAFLEAVTDPRRRGQSRSGQKITLTRRRPRHAYKLMTVPP